MALKALAVLSFNDKMDHSSHEEFKSEVKENRMEVRVTTLAGASQNVLRCFPYFPLNEKFNL